MKYKQKLREGTTKKVNRTIFKDINIAVKKIYLLFNLFTMFKNALKFVKTKVFVVY
jgi:hypothetical protein